MSAASAKFSKSAHCIIYNVADILNQLVKFHIIGAKHMLLTKIFYNYQAMGGVIRNPAVLDRPDPPAHSSAGVATIRDHIKPSHGDDPHSLNLVDPLHGHLEVHHDEVHNLASQPVYWDLVQTKTSLKLSGVDSSSRSLETNTLSQGVFLFIQGMDQFPKYPLKQILFHNCCINWASLQKSETNK